MQKERANTSRTSPFLRVINVHLRLQVASQQATFVLELVHHTNLTDSKQVYNNQTFTLVSSSVQPLPWWNFCVILVKTCIQERIRSIVRCGKLTRIVGLLQFIKFSTKTGNVCVRLIKFQHNAKRIQRQLTCASLCPEIQEFSLELYLHCGIPLVVILPGN